MKKRISLLASFLFLLHYLNVAQVPGTLSYQGILVDAGGAPVYDGNHSVTFSFYTAASGGSAVFSRGPITVQTYKGLFTIIIGDGTTNNAALPVLSTDINYIGGSQYFLEVVADGVTLSPRAQLSTVPYALHAQNANTMNASGLTGSGTLPSSVLPSTSVTAGSYGSATQVPTFTVDAKGRLTAASNVAITGSGWSLTGNAGTVDGTNFIGTTDNIPLSFRVNNLKAGRLDVTLSNTFYGIQSGNANTTGINNTAVGKQALFSNTTGLNNTANGLWSLYSNTVGGLNTAVGVDALYSNVAGSGATAIGHNAMQYANNQAGAFTNSNVAVGYEALRGSTTASANTGNSNTAIGYQTLYNNTTGIQNFAGGPFALYANTTGDANIAIGWSSLSNNTTGIANTAIGNGALSANTNGFHNIAIGSSPLSANITGNNNIGIGSNTLSSNTTGQENVAIGQAALFSNTISNRNVAIGNAALNSNVSGTNAVAVGYGAMLYANNTATSFTNSNVAIGYETLRGSTTASANTGNNNTAIGYQSLQINSTGGSNVANGYWALINNSSGGGNTAIGSEALSNNTTGTNNTAIGILANVATGNLTNATAIGANSVVAASNSIVLGGTGASAVKVGIGLQTPLIALHVDGNATNETVRIEANTDPLLSFYAGATNRGFVQAVGADMYFGTSSGSAGNVILFANGSSGFTMNSSRLVGLSRTPTTNRLEVNGEASKTVAGSWVANSDRRIKTDINDIDNSLDLIMRLRPVKFKYTPEWRQRNPSIKEQYYYNYIAQEYQQVFPESVKGSGEYLENDPEEILQMDSQNAQIISVKAIQELIKKIELLEAENLQLRKEFNDLKSELRVEAKINHE